MSPHRLPGRTGSGLRGRDRSEWTVPLAILVSQFVLMTSATVVAIAARASVDDRLLLRRPIFVHPVGHCGSAGRHLLQINGGALLP